MIAAPEMIRACAAALRPPELLRPSEFASRYRHLKPGTTEKPGRWDSSYFPHIVPIMDAVQEALEGDWDGLALMKAAQGAGSEGMINALAWARASRVGPILYLISKDEIAKEFGRERFDYLLETCEPLKRLAIRGKGSGETIQYKRFATGKVVIQGGRSVLNIESTPYLIVFVDELDSLQAVIEGKGDLIKTIQARMKAFRQPTLVVAFAHPTTKAQGVGQLYYERSDQRRGFVDCPHCGGEFWLCWERDVKVFPEEGETVEVAERDPRRYRYVAPCCGVFLVDAERWKAIRDVRQESTLTPEEAAKKRWIGLHFGELYYPHVPLAKMAAEWIEGMDAPEVRRVTVNKSHGDTHEPKTKGTDTAQWRACIAIPRRPDDPAAYTLGQVPPGVEFLTAGQDSRTTELHWCVWGWGLLKNIALFPMFCGWLVDAGVVPRDYSETIDAADLQVFDQLLYDRGFPRTEEKKPGKDKAEALYVRHGYHDEGWCPVAVYQYCLRRPSKAICAKGDAVDSASSAPIHRWGSPPRWKIGDQEVSDPRLRRALLNTHVAKESLFGMVGRRFDRADGQPQTQIVLPANISAEWIEQSASEYLVEKKGKQVWEHKGPNHWSDCNVQAFAAAMNLHPFLRGKTRDEHVQEAQRQAEAARRRKAARGGRRPGGIRRSY